MNFLAISHKTPLLIWDLRFWHFQSYPVKAIFKILAPKILRTKIDWSFIEKRSNWLRLYKVINAFPKWVRRRLLEDHVPWYLRYETCPSKTKLWRLSLRIRHLYVNQKFTDFIEIKIKCFIFDLLPVEYFWQSYVKSLNIFSIFNFIYYTN